MHAKKEMLKESNPNKFVLTWLGFAVGGFLLVWYTSAVICSPSPWKQKVCSGAFFFFFLDVLRLSAREDAGSDIKQGAGMTNEWEIRCPLKMSYGSRCFQAAEFPELKALRAKLIDGLFGCDGFGVCNQL